MKALGATATCGSEVIREGRRNLVAQSMRDLSCARWPTTHSDTLSPTCRRAFALHRGEGLTYPEIDAGMGISVKVVEKHISRTLVMLRTALYSARPMDAWGPVCRAGLSRASALLQGAGAMPMTCLNVIDRVATSGGVGRRRLDIAFRCGAWNARADGRKFVEALAGRHMTLWSLGQDLSPRFTSPGSLRQQDAPVARLR